MLLGAGRLEGREKRQEEEWSLGRRFRGERKSRHRKGQRKVSKMGQGEEKRGEEMEDGMINMDIEK